MKYKTYILKALYLIQFMICSNSNIILAKDPLQTIINSDSNAKDIQITIVEYDLTNCANDPGFYIDYIHTNNPQILKIGMKYQGMKYKYYNSQTYNIKPKEFSTLFPKLIQATYNHNTQNNQLVAIFNHFDVSSDHSMIQCKEHPNSFKRNHIISIYGNIKPKQVTDILNKQTKQEPHTNKPLYRQTITKDYFYYKQMKRNIKIDSSIADYIYTNLLIIMLSDYLRFESDMITDQESSSLKSQYNVFEFEINTSNLMKSPYEIKEYIERTMRSKKLINADNLKKAKKIFTKHQSKNTNNIAENNISKYLSRKVILSDDEMHKTIDQVTELELKNHVRKILK